MKTYLWIALGSALGGMARYWLTTLASSRLNSSFPWGTFIVNASGSFLIGLIAAWPGETLPPMTRSFLTIGVLGGFTTFSAFSLQTAGLFQSGHASIGLIYAISSVVLCPLLAWAGWTLASRA